MRLTTLQAAIGSASVLLCAQPTLATHGHRHAHDEHVKRHDHGHHAVEELLIEAPKPVAKRATCTLPDDPDLFYVPGASNNGFAMSPDQVCEDQTYCPLACVSGKVMAQWQPNSTYIYPQSMNGGLYCNGGTAEKPFPEAEYCVEGTGTVTAVNDVGESVAICQTVLPGNEAMLIPTLVTTSATLAVPGPDYWDGTAAHYYINPPGVSIVDGCVWGDPSKPWGNWAPYVAGANTDSNGLTYVKIGYNPIWTGSPLSNTVPTFGLEITCNGGGCNGLPCSINPATDGVGVTNSPDAANGAGGASFCVVTVPSGGSANLVIFNTDGSADAPKVVSSSSSAPPSSTQVSTSKPATTSSTTSTTTSTTSSSSTSSTTTTSTSTTSSTLSTTSTLSSTPLSSTTLITTTFSPKSSTPSPTPTPSRDALIGGIFHENSTYSSVAAGSGPDAVTAPASLSTSAEVAAAVTTTSKSEGAGDQGGVAVVGLIVAFVAAAALY